MRRVLTSLALVSGALVACADKAPAPGVPGAAAGAPVATAKSSSLAMAPEQRARIVGGAASSQPAGVAAGIADSQPAGDLPPGHPPLGAGQGQAPVDPANPHAGMPMGAAMGNAPAGGVGTGGGGTLEGTITLDPGRSADIKAGGVLFIIVRRDAGEGQKGTLMASKRLEVTGPDMFPLSYEIGPENVMMGGSSLDGVVRVEARVDQDGDAISKNPGDVVGARAGAVTVGASGIDFVLKDLL